MHDFLTKRVDNSPLILFRMLFGVLMAYQCFYYIYDGWVFRNFISPKFTFTHIGFEFLQPLPGNGMYFYFAIMGICALGVAFGWFYRISLALFLALWTSSYWMQKTNYNNHHYLIILVAVLLLFVPANTYACADVKRSGKRFSMPDWVRWLFISQMAIVYFYAAIAKLYPDWMNGTFSGIALGNYGKHYGIALLQQHWFHLCVAWFGLLFDFFIVPMLLWKRTRILAVIALFVFHTFNSVTLDIGIFPFFALSFVLFFFDPNDIRRVFFPKKPVLDARTIESETVGNTTILKYVIAPYLLLQLLLPLRHWLIKGDVLWTEEGHKLSWRMMLRERKGTAKFTVIDRKSGDTLEFDQDKELTKPQRKALATHPDMIWQMAQRIHSQFGEQGKDVAVYVKAEVSINRKPKKLLVDPNVDMALVKWDYFWHCPWILDAE
ncbi:HTTM domain-containing protein [Flavobacterium sp.]|uniref:HTTM domain-containing protein n=1 Tax=Flavobacterium sp. TaxID=239 RepID=UPI00120FDCC7|nr:HTTM domain-containing protein [Flavobacterium sp.]RZJ69039.1 MAG: hypothetical protein EOO49_18765 [Flavobacterium sp.]